MAINLPSKPTPDDFEDFVAACLLGLGYFIETNITLKEGTTEVLQLDVVASPSGNNFLRRRVYDAKTGKLSFRDLFTLYGWMQYLKITDGCLVYKDELDPERLEALTKISGETGARSCHLSQAGDPRILAEPAIDIPDPLRKKIISIAWYCRIAQRKALAAFYDQAKINPDSPLIKSTRHYRASLQQALFARTAIITGIPLEDVSNCLTFIDKFFPHDKGWFYEQKELRRMKLMPAMFQGAGCFLRKDLYEIKEYEAKFPEQGWLLSRWHNALYFILEPSLKVTEAKKE
jgi:hypothetical protein